MTFSLAFRVEKPRLSERIKARFSPKPKFSMEQAKVESFLAPHHHQGARKLSQALEKHSLDKSSVRLYYPGCGQDSVWPLLVLQGLARSAKEWTIIGHDPELTIGCHIATVQGITANKIFSMKSDQKTGIHQARFEFSDKILAFIHLHHDAICESHPEVEKGFDIMLDRGFEIMRAQQPGFIERNANLLNPGGLILTDAGFKQLPRGVKKVGVSHPPWGFYKTPALYRKEE